MNRRTALKWLSGLLAFATAAVAGIPGVSFVLEAVRKRHSREGAFVQRIARWSDLPPGKPVQVPVIGSHRDAWTVHPQEVIGRVWLVRAPESAPTDESSVAAFTSVCPHLGCVIQLDPQGENFVCPCHRAAFAFNGLPLSEQRLGRKNHSPRGMDSLESRLVQDSETHEWWVEVNYEKFVSGLTKKIIQA